MVQAVRSLRERAARGLRAAASALAESPRPEPEGEAERLASYPPPFPAGWYALCRSRDLGTGPRRVDALGQHFVVFRRGSGVAVLDAHCPHMGADLSLGRVKDDCLSCPFHAWTFEGDGRVAHVPYASAPPKRSLSTRAWAAEERDGFVFAYVDPEHRARGVVPEPPYRLPSWPGIADGSFVHRGDHDAGIVRMHLQEFAENSADTAHFAPLHGQMTLPWSRVPIPGVRIEHDASWETDPEAPHTTWFRDQAVLSFFGRRVERTRAQAAICIAGPGGVVTFHFDVPDVGKIILYQTHLPVGPLAQRIHFRWYAERRVPRALSWYVVGNWVAQWRADIAIWETKVYRPRPMLVGGDGPILEMRRWYRRFHPTEPAPPAGDSTPRATA